ncbi:MAG: hypothetical protein PHO08_13880 [Methylococcales bacterium]|nr:hypothetical protein [Methylococcales bacterium]MDD5632292.1 hypothetical protein [Methylococcales bacterium]
MQDLATENQKNYRGQHESNLHPTLHFLRANGFKAYVDSGGGFGFMRPWTEKAFGVPAEQVIGSSIKTKYELVDGKPVLIRLPEIDFVDDKAGKPAGIQKFTGR